jgi:hypothetical protein
MEQFGDRQVGDLIVDRRAQEDDPLAEQTRVDIEGALTVHGLLDHHRNLRAHLCLPLPSLRAFVRVFPPARRRLALTLAHARPQARAMHTTVRVTATEATNRDRWREAILAFFLRQRRSNSDGFEHSAEALNLFRCGLTQEQRGLNTAAKATA